MSELKSLLRTPGMTNAQVRTTNWAMLATILLVSLLGFLSGNVELALRTIGNITGIYALGTLLLPLVVKRMHPGAPVARKGAWWVAVAGYGGVFVLFVLWTLSDGGMP